MSTNFSMAPPTSAPSALILRGVEVRRDGRVEPYLHDYPTLSSVSAGWSGIALEDHVVPACIIPQHEHLQNFLHVVLEGSVDYEVRTRGKIFKFHAVPGTTFILPRGTVDELRWSGPTHRIAASLHPSLLANALDGSPAETAISLTEHWNLADANILSVLLAMRTDLEAGSPTGRLYGESLSTALAIYLLKRYGVTRLTPTVFKGGLPKYRLNRVLDYIGENVCADLSLSQLAEVSGMSAHYFAEMFRQSTGRAPHQYVLMRRIDLAKERLRDPTRNIIDVALDVGFQNPSHFARAFRKHVGISPSRFRSESRCSTPIGRRNGSES